MPVEHTEFQMYDYLLNENGELVDYGDAPADYQTDVYSERAVEFIESSSASRRTRSSSGSRRWRRTPRASSTTVDAPRETRAPRPATTARSTTGGAAAAVVRRGRRSDKPDVVREAANLPGRARTPARGRVPGRLESLLAVDRMVGDIVAR